MPEDVPDFSVQDALNIMRDPSSPIVRQMLASKVLHPLKESLSTEDLLTCMRGYRSAGWWAAHELHDRTGRPKVLSEHGFLVYDADEWKKYFDQTELKNRP